MTETAPESEAAKRKIEVAYHCTLSGGRRGSLAAKLSSRRIISSMTGGVLCTVFVGLLGVLMPCFSAAQTFALDSTNGLQPHDVKIEALTYLGRKAVRVTPVLAADAELAAPKNGEGGGIVVLQGTSFRDGTIEVYVAGMPRAGAFPDARGFVGLAFRVNTDASKYECFYIRPTNGRADDQLRRNHSTQYISMPDYPWARLRKESPGQYESYVDLASGEWTKIKVEVHGVKARLYVNDSAQPVLIVNDLKHSDSQGSLALWIGMGTEAYFADLRVLDGR